MVVQPVVEQYADDSRRDYADDDLEPEPPGLPFLHVALRRREGVELVKIKHDDGEYRAELYHDPEHLHERVADVEPQKLIRENHVSGARDRQPFGDALYNADYYYFNEFDGKTEIGEYDLKDLLFSTQDGYALNVTGKLVIKEKSPEPEPPADNYAPSSDSKYTGTLTNIKAEKMQQEEYRNLDKRRRNTIEQASVSVEGDGIKLE